MLVDRLKHPVDVGDTVALVVADDYGRGRLKWGKVIEVEGVTLHIRTESGYTVTRGSLEVAVTKRTKDDE